MPPASGHRVLVNSRVLSVPSNGQKRVAEEIIARLGDLDFATPDAASASGLRGHAWEQLALPLAARGRRLWSPSTTGPVVHPNHIVTVHDIAFVDGREWFSRSFVTVYDLVVGRLVKSARHIITVSEFTRQRLIEHYRADPRRVTAVLSGSTPGFRRTSHEAVAEAKARLGVTGTRHLVAFLGSDPRKNTPAVIDAWSSIAPRHPDARLVTFGRTSNSRVFAAPEARGDNPTILHVGPVSDDDLAALYTGSAGLVFPSLYEGFGLPVIEAAACGSPILTSSVSALPEVSPPDARLVDPRSVAEIAAGMEALLERQDTESDKAGRIAHAGAFTWERTAQGYSRLFEEHFA